MSDQRAPELLVNTDFLSIFLEESGEVLSAWERSCLDLERNFDAETIDALFRSAHNLKGSARSVGLHEYGAFIHKAEDVIQLVRAGERPFTPEVCRALLRAQSLLLDWRARLGSKPEHFPAMEVEALGRELEACGASTQKQEAVPESDIVFLSDPVPGPERMVKSVSAITHPSEGAAGARGLRKPDAPLPSEGNKREAGNPQAAESVRVPAAKIDELMQLVGELATQQAMIAHAHLMGTHASSACQRAVHASLKLAKQVQIQTLGLRMQTVTPLFQRLERIARDLARDQGKSLLIELEGAEAELDKSVIERITDPLVHIVRNAIDHGVELPAERVAAGKASWATLRLSASEGADGVMITVGEDGRGIDPDRLIAKARERGLPVPSEGEPAERAYGLIFLPGFSTAETITEVSGRGVGLDVVKRAIDALGGNVSISSNRGTGTSFVISMPTNVSILESLVVRVAGQAYVAPIREIAEVIDLGQLRGRMEGSQGFVTLRDRAVAVRDLAEFLPNEIAPAPRPPADVNEGPGQRGIQPALVVARDGTYVAFSVDGIASQQSVVARGLPDNLQGLPGIAGGTLLASGEPTMILSLKDFADAFFKTLAAA